MVTCSIKAQREREMHHKAPNLANKHILWSPLKDRPFFQRRLSGSLKNAFKIFFIFEDNQSQQY